MNGAIWVPVLLVAGALIGLIAWRAEGPPDPELAAARSRAADHLAREVPHPTRPGHVYLADPPEG